MTEGDPTPLRAALHAVIPTRALRPQPVDNSVDSASTAGHAAVETPCAGNDRTQTVGNDGPSIREPDTTFPEPANASLVDDHDPDGLDVAFRVADRLGTAVPPPRRRSPARRKAGDLEPVGGVLDAFIEERGWTTQVGLRMLLAAWPDLVGEDNAAHTKPESFADGVLTVRAESSTWATALRFVAPQVLATLNGRLGDGAVTRLQVLGPAAPSWRHGPRSVRDGRGPRDTYG